MASTTFSNPGIGNLFSGLAGIFAGPDPQKLMQADYLRTQRDNLMSDTAINGQTLGTMKREEAGITDYSDILADPEWMLTPEGRAAGASAVARAKGGLQFGPQSMVGFGTATDPNMYGSQSDLSNALVGTGMITDYGNTPTGYEQGLANELDVQRLKNESDLAVTLAGGKTPGSLATVSPGTAAKFSEMVAAGIAQQFGGAALEDPTLIDGITSRATQVYQQTKNADLAVAQAIEEANLQMDAGGNKAHLSLNPLDWFDWAPNKLSGDAPGLGDVLVGQNNGATPANLTPAPEAAPIQAPVLPNAPAAAPAQGAAPAAPAPAPAGNAQGPSVHTDGQGAFFVGKGGKRVPLTEGMEIQSPSTNQKIYFVGGQWTSAPGGN